MMFPLTFEDLGLFLAVIALILLVTLGLIPLDKEKITALLSVKKLKKAAIIVSILFMITVILRIINLILFY